jgi:MinD-like ATPase involved in chromosome partitioning or flagellar assembly
MSGLGGSDRDAIAPPGQDPGQQTDSASPEQSSGSSSLESDSLLADAGGHGARAPMTSTMPEEYGTPRSPGRAAADLPVAQVSRSAEPRPPRLLPVPQHHQHTSAAATHAGAAEAAAWALMGDELRTAGLISERKIPSEIGWRKFLRVATLGIVKLGQSPDERRVRELNATVDSPLRGTHSVVVLGGKGGAGKTTVTVGVGSMFALLRHDKVVAIDGNPDIGANLGERVDPTSVSSYREVLADDRLERYADMRSHVGQNPASGLDALAANRHVRGRKLLDAKTYLATHERLQRFYSVLVTDSGTNVEHPVAKGLLDNANSIILVASCTLDSAQAVGRVMDWLRESGYRDLLANSVVVLNEVTGRTDRKMADSLVEAFSRHVGADRVFVLPHDPHLAAGGVVDIDRLRRATRRRLLEITAAVAANFSRKVGAL